MGLAVLTMAGGESREWQGQAELLAQGSLPTCQARELPWENWEPFGSGNEPKKVERLF